MSSAAASEERIEHLGAEVGAPSPLPLVLELVRGLAQAEVRYCHWKSNVAIDRSLSGLNDLDLLIESSARPRFEHVLSGLGFVRVHRPGPAIPGIESFYGYDSEHDRFVHVHAHDELVLGDDRTKNYRLPLEDAYIRSSSPTPAGLPVPAPELELLVLVVRMTLKYCTWDEAAWSALRRRSAGPSASERRELEYLRARVDPDRLASAVAEHLPAVAAGLFADCVAAAFHELPLRDRLRTGRSLERALASNARRSRRVDGALRTGRRVAIAVSRRARPAPRMRLEEKGALVGVMGGDGAGKSTALAALEDWLGPRFDVRVVHLGKPRWSVTTTAVRGTLKVASTATHVLRRVAPVRPVERLGLAVSDYRPLLWLLCTARDRRNTYAHARSFADDGGLVLCDRYPHPRLSSMEVPLIATRAGERANGRFVQAMIRLEERYHRAIEPAELLVVLRVDPETAVTRKVDESSESVRRRSAEVWAIDWRAAGAHVVDAGQPPESVARELKKLVWSAVS